MGLKEIFRLMSPAGGSGRLSVFIFHRVLASKDLLFPDVPDATRFDTLLGWLTSWFNVLPLDQALARLVDGSVPERAAAITFDDGYADNYLVALPLLQRHGISATFFIATGFLDGGRMWNDTVIEAVRSCDRAVLDLTSLHLGQYSLATIEDRRVAIAALIDRLKYVQHDKRLEMSSRIGDIADVPLPNDLMLTSAQVRLLNRGGMQIGAHTVTHPILAMLDDASARREIEESRNALERLLGSPVRLFAYPNGRTGIDYSPAHARMAREIGFDAALTTTAGVATARSDLMEVPRFTPWDRGRAKFGARLAVNLYRARSTEVRALAY